MSADATQTQQSPCGTVQLLDLYTAHFKNADVAANIMLSFINTAVSLPNGEDFFTLMSESWDWQTLKSQLPPPDNFVLPGIAFLRFCRDRKIGPETRDMLLRAYLSLAADDPSFSMQNFLAQMAAAPVPEPEAEPQSESAPAGDLHLKATLEIGPDVVRKAVGIAHEGATPSWASGPLLVLEQLGHGLVFSQEIVGGGDGHVYTSTTIYNRETGALLYEFPPISNNIEIGIFRTCAATFEYNERKTHVVVDVVAWPQQPVA